MPDFAVGTRHAREAEELATRILVARAVGGDAFAHTVQALLNRILDGHNPPLAPNVKLELTDRISPVLLALPLVAKAAAAAEHPTRSAACSTPTTRRR